MIFISRISGKIKSVSLTVRYWQVIPKDFQVILKGFQYDLSFLKKDKENLGFGQITVR